MAVLNIRGVPEDVARAVRARAAMQGMKVREFVLLALRKALQSLQPREGK